MPRIIAGAGADPVGDINNQRSTKREQGHRFKSDPASTKSLGN